VPGRVVDDWFWVPEQRPAAACRLVCLPYAGGDAFVFNGLAAALPAGVEVWAVRLPNRDPARRRAGPRRLDDVVEAVANAIRRRAHDGQVLLGQSFGGLLAYEVGLALPAGEGPSGVVIASLAAPGRLRRTAAPRRPAELIEHLARLHGPEAAWLRDPRLVDPVLPVLAEDLALLDDFVGRPERRLNRPLHVLVGAGDPSASYEDAEAWSARTQRWSGVSVVEGGHLVLQRRPEAAARALTAVLADWRVPGLRAEAG
jgi:pyochelin biosynthesis protein PchC